MELKLANLACILERYRLYMGEQGLRERTIEQYHRYVRKCIEYGGTQGIEDLKQIDKLMLGKYQGYLYRETKLSLSSQGGRLIAIKNFFSYLNKTDQLLYDPSSGISLPRRVTRVVRNMLNEHEMKKLLNAPDLDRVLGLRDRALLEVLYSTGIRNTELRELTLYDIDRERGVLVVREGKGGDGRVVPLGEIALKYILLYLEHSRPKLIKEDASNAVLFVSYTGKKLARKDLPRIVGKYAQAAGIRRRVGAHSIRHSVATHLLRHGAPIRYIQEFLGHRSLNTTQIYTRVEITDLKKVHQKTHPRELYP